MNPKTIVALLVLATGGMATAGSDTTKRYGIQHAKIRYEIRGGGDIMGMVKTKIKGKKRVIFDHYGTKEITEVAKVTQTTTNGKSKMEKVHTMTYINGGTLYRVDFKHKRIIRMKNAGMAAATLFGGAKNRAKNGKAMMQKMGGKMIGKDKVLGYTCEVWDLMGVQQCIYKGVVLRIVSDIMGMKNSEVATQIDFSPTLNPNSFKLPDFPIYDVQGNKLERSKLDTMDERSEVKAEKNAEDMAALGAAMATAMQSAGVKKGETLTKAQEKKMENSMMNAMFPRMKRKMLAESKALEFAKVCLEKADTLKEANACEEKMDTTRAEPSGPEDKLQKWDSKTKKETLGFIDQALKNMECAKKANSMQEMRQCMPEN